MFGACRCERGKADHIAGGGDVRHFGLKQRVDLEAAAIVGGESGLVERKLCGGADAADREENGIDFDVLSAFEIDGGAF